MTVVPKVDDLFGGDPGLSAAEKSRRFDEYQTALSQVAVKTITPDAVHSIGQGHAVDFSTAPSTPHAALLKALQSPDITKGLSADGLASITQALEAAKAVAPDMVKDLTTSSPISTGLVAFDLEAPAKYLVPRMTPLRNRIPRRKGMGLARRFKTITGISGSGTGGVGVMRPGIADTTQTSFAPSGASNALYFARGGKITYAGADTTIPYIQFSASDQVSWSAQFAGQGYQDIRSLSRTSLLYASMLLEERVLLYGRGTTSPYSGTLAAPTGVTGTARTAATGETALSGYTSNIYVRVVAEMGDFGVSQATAATTAIAVTSGQVVDVACTLPAGATGMRVFVSTGSSDPGDASRYLYATRSGYNTLTLQGALPTSGTVPTSWTLSAGGTANLTSADGGSAVATEYDGVLAYCTGSNSGYRGTLNTTFSNTNPGGEYQTAFAAMYDAVKADPDRVLFNGSDRKQLSDAVKGSSSSNYAIRLAQDDVTGYTLGTMVTTIVNEVTGKGVDLEVHPWLPQGNSLILSDTLPIPDTEVSDVWAAYNVQDLMGVDWPVNQFAFESSSYWFGSLVCYAPAWNGSICGIKKVA